MTYRKPHCEDVAEILLAYAPKSFLDEIPLSIKNLNEFIDEFDSVKDCVFGNYDKDDLICWAFYYAQKNYFKSNNRNAEKILKETALPFDLVSRLIIYIEPRDNQEYKKCDSGPMKSSINKRNKWRPAREIFDELMMKNPNAKVEETRRLAAKEAGFDRIPTDKTLRDHMPYKKDTS